MKKLFTILLAASLSTSIFNATAAITPGSKTERLFQEERPIKNFTGVAAGGPIEVIITIGSTESLKFEGDAEAIASLVSEVKGTVLIIRPKTSWTSWSHKYENKKIIARVTAKDITSLTMSGDGSIKVNGTALAKELTATLSGSGSITANIDTERLTSVLSGSGTLNLTGKGGDADVTLSGSGKFNGKTLALVDLNTRISGSGSVNVKVDGNIKALISGSGHVYYTGNPSIEQRVIGSGGVSKS
ncbi:MAG: head GIN domain-containing protein [Bacteroidota bacterium]